MSDRLDKAISDFENENLPLTLGERISGIRQALLLNIPDILKQIKKLGKNDPTIEDLEYKHMECMKWYKDLEKLFFAEIRMNKVLGRTSEKMETDFLKNVKEMKGSIGNIVRDIIPTEKPQETNVENRDF